MAIGDLYQLIDRQDLLGQEVINRYHYVNVSLGGNANDLADAYIQDVLPSVLATQRSGLEHKTIEVINLDDLTDFHTETLVGATGTYPTGEGQLPFVTLSMKLVRSTRAIRNGRKAISGISEEFTNASGLDPAVQPLVDALAVAMGATIAAPLSAAGFEPTILGEPNDNRPTEIRVPVAGVVFGRIGTQNSRKE